MQNIKSFAITLFIAGFSYLSIFDSAVSAVEISDYTIKSIVIKEESHLKENYPKVKDLLNVVEEKVVQQEKSYPDTDYKKARLDVELAKKDLARFDYAYKLGSIQKAIDYINKVLSELRNAQFELMPSRTVEARGLYIDADSIPTTKKEIADLILEIKKANINIIYPEVFRRGYTIFSNSIADIDGRFKNIKFDVLKELIDEAHKQNIEVDPWIWTFRIKSPLYDDAFMKKYPALVARREIYKFEDREPLFLSPAEPKARMLILRLLRQLAINYKIDGLLMDYIRYDETLGNDILTKKYFREYYLNKYDKEPPLTIKQTDPIFNEWQIWREEQVTTMVKSVRRELLTHRPEMKIGVAIFRTEKEGRLLKMQDWRHWGNNQYIDYVCPMLYTDNNRDLNDWLNSETDNNTRFDFIYPSLGAHRFNTTDDFFPEVGLIHKRNIPGMNIFSLIHFGRENLPDLAKGVFRKPALIPDRNFTLSVKDLLSEISLWLKGIAYSEKDIPVKNLKNLIYKNDKLNQRINSSINSENGYKELGESLEDLKKYANTLSNDKGFPLGLISEINEHYNYILRLNEIENHKLITRDKYFPPTLPPIPANKNR